MKSHCRRVGVTATSTGISMLPRQPPLPVVLGQDDARSNVGGGSGPTDDRLDLRLVDDQAVELVLGDDRGDGGAVLAVLDRIAADFLQLGVLARRR